MTTFSQQTQHGGHRRTGLIQPKFQGKLLLFFIFHRIQQNLPQVTKVPFFWFSCKEKCPFFWIILISTVGILSLSKAKSRRINCKLGTFYLCYDIRTILISCSFLVALLYRLEMVRALQIFGVFLQIKITEVFRFQLFSTFRNINMQTCTCS